MSQWIDETVKADRTMEALHTCNYGEERRSNVDAVIATATTERHTLS